MIRYLPTIYEGELLSSWLLRAFTYSPYISSAPYRQTIFAKPTVSIDWLFYNEYTSEFRELLEEKYGLKYLIEKHTLVPFYSSFFTSEQKNNVMNKAINTEPCITHFLSYPTIHMRHIKYCPICIQEHIEPFFEREPQVIGINHCPIHKCKYRSTSILLDREKLFEFKSVDLLDFDMSNDEILNEENINIRVARYISKFLHTAPNYDNYIPIGSFLTHKLEGTKYLSIRGGQRNLDLLLKDLEKFYQGLEFYDLTKWRLSNLLRNRFINIYDIVLIAYFLNVNIQDLTHPYLPPKSQIELFDEKAIEFHKQGFNVNQIAKLLNVNKEVVRQVLLGTYKK